MKNHGHEDGHGVRHTFADFRASPSMLKTKACLYILLSLVGFAYAIIAFITSVNAYSTIGKNPLALSGIINNWRDTPIIDIKTTTSDSCPSGYSQMFTRYWPGTKEGCNWNGEIKVKSGKCGSGWTDIDSQLKTEYTYFYGKKIWVKRSGSNIMKAIRIDKDSSPKVWTQKDYRAWGAIAGDINNKVCVISSSDCPINDIKISTVDKFDDYNNQPLGNGYKIHFTSKADSLPLVDFTLTEGNVCIYSNEFDRPSTKKIYPLLKTWKYNGWEDKIGDLSTDEKRWKNIVGEKEAELISDNKEISDIIQKLPNYPITDSTFSLFSMPYIKWTLDCQNSDTAPMNKIAEDNNPINTLANVQLFYMIISFLSLLINSLISPGFIIYKQTMTLMGKQEVEKDIIASNGMRLIAAIFIVLKASFLISSLVIIKNFNNMVDYIQDNKWTDETTTAIFTFLRGVLSDAYDQNVYGIITVGVMAGWELIATMILWVFSCNLRRQENQDHFIQNKKHK